MLLCNRFSSNNPKNSSKETRGCQKNPDSEGSHCTLTMSELVLGGCRPAPSRAGGYKPRIRTNLSQVCFCTQQGATPTHLLSKCGRFHSNKGQESLHQLLHSPESLNIHYLAFYRENFAGLCSRGILGPLTLESAEGGKASLYKFPGSTPEYLVMLGNG